MIVEIINVGTELLLGEIINTNATDIQKLCKELGFNVYYQTIVGDNPKRFKECLEVAFKRGANCVITTGGLGPTEDDLTKEIAAEYLGLALEYNEEEARKVADKCGFVSHWQAIPENNFKQAWFPKDCYIVENEIGTANGCVMSKDDKMIINLPGPPKELRYVLEHTLKPYLLPYQKEKIYTYDYTTMGIGESRVAEVLKDIVDQQKEVSVALYASEENVRIRLGCVAINQEEADAIMATTKEQIDALLGEFCVNNKDPMKVLYEIMPPYHFHYISDFRLRDGFVLGKEISDDKDSLEIVVDMHPHRLGEIVEITLHYQGKEKTFTVPLLKKAELSYPRLESKMKQNIYMFITELNQK